MAIKTKLYTYEYKKMMNKKFAWLILAALFIVSCGEKKTETASEDEMKAEEVKDTSVTENKKTEVNLSSDSLAFSKFVIDPKLPFEKKVDLFIEKYTLLYSEIEQNKPIVPERYSSTFSKKIALKKNSTVPYGKADPVYPVAQLWFYQYEDSTSCRNVITNWLQCYGFDCSPVEFMQEPMVIKTTPSMAILTEREIVFLQYQCEHTGNNWNDIKKELEKLFGEKTYYTITLDNCGKKLIWKKHE